MTKENIHLFLVIGGVILIEIYEIINKTWSASNFLLRVMEYWFCLLIADEVISNKDVDVQMLSIIIINNLRLSYAKILNHKEELERGKENDKEK